MFQGGKVVLSTSSRPDDMCALIEKHRVTHLKVVPALLIRLLNDPAVKKYDLSSLRYIQSGGQRLQPEVRLLSRKLIPSAFIQENFGMSEGLIMFVRIDDPEDVRLETVGRPVSPDDEVRILDDDLNEVPFGEVGELCCRGPYTLRGYYGVARVQAIAFHSGRFLPLGRSDAAASFRKLHGRGTKEGSHQPRRRKNQRGGSGKPHPVASRGQKRRLHRHSRSDAWANACAPACCLRDGANLTFHELSDFLRGKEIAKYKLPERLEILEDFPLSTFGKVSKKKLVEMISRKIAAEQPDKAAPCT